MRLSTIPAIPIPKYVVELWWAESNRMMYTYYIQPCITTSNRVSINYREVMVHQYLIWVSLSIYNKFISYYRSHFFKWCYKFRFDKCVCYASDDIFMSLECYLNIHKTSFWIMESSLNNRDCTLLYHYLWCFWITVWCLFKVLIINWIVFFC